MVLIDSDQSFSDMMRCGANKYGYDLTCYSSVSNMGTIGKFRDYDVAIVDNDDGFLSGLEIGKLVISLIVNMPMVLVSRKFSAKALPRKEWPSSIKGLIQKELGALAIFKATLAAMS